MTSTSISSLPLASRIRPRSLSEFIGQPHLVGPNKPLYQAIQTGNLHSMVFWGPPGTGKTTLANIIAEHVDAHFLPLSAVMVGLKEVRQEIQKAKARLDESQQRTVLFLDEVHRFNKSQQDAFLPHVEDGTIIFIGATTENPSFELNNALLSRVTVYTLDRLTEQDILKIINHAIDHLNHLATEKLSFSEEATKLLAEFSDGDARQALNLLEIVFNQTSKTQVQSLHKTITKEHLQKMMSTDLRKFDKKGDCFYDQISALHKAVRGSSPDGALYWFARMLDGGVDPLYIARRIVRIASEDIGNADPKALEITLNAWQVQERLGNPEGELAIAQAIVYLSVAPKSNAVYRAFSKAQEDARKFGAQPVPLHIRNAPTQLMKTLEHGKAYRYDHDEPSAFSIGQTYFPEKIGERIYYEPVNRGLEIKIREKLNELRKLSGLTKNPPS